MNAEGARKQANKAGRQDGSQERLKSSVEAAAYQKEWFKNTREIINRGEPFALAQADTPHEIFLTMDIPVVPVQWWSAVIALSNLPDF